MPRQIVATERDKANQAEMWIGDPNVWVRIDKADGSIFQVSGVNVLRAAQGAFRRPNHAIATGRFATTFAIYCTADRLTDDEKRTVLA